MIESNIRKYISANILVILGYLFAKFVYDYINLPPNYEDLIIRPEFPYVAKIFLCGFCILAAMVLFGVEFFLRKKYKFNHFLSNYKLPKLISILYWIIFTIGFVFSFFPLFRVTYVFLEVDIFNFLPPIFSEIVSGILILYIIILLFKKAV